jgi:PAS domain S-box-containing protein
VPNIVWTALPDGTIDYFNRRWFEYTGISVERAAGSWRSVVHPDDLAARDEAWKHALETGQVADIRCRLRRADGKYRWHVCRAVPERGAAGQIVAWLGSFTDIEDERRASAVLTEFKGTLDAVLDAVFIFDASDWHLLYVNLGASALLGYTQEELLDMRRPTDFMAEHDETSFRELLAPILRGEQSTLTLETRFRRKTASTVPVEMSLQLIRVDGGRIVSIARDITERARVRRERELLYRETVDALRARDEFLSIASHELRSPLGALELQITTLLQPPNDPGSAPTGALKKKLEVAARQVEQMSRLITELLDVTRISSGRMDLDREVTDLAALARDLIDRFATDAAKAESTVELDAPEPVIGSWDSLRLDQVLTNLLTNALKFGAGKPIEISVTRVGSNARVTVTDHGIGIEPENLDRIFHRFEQAVSTRTYGGFGLGLYIVRGIVEAHGGTVHVESEPQVRTTFSIELPLQPLREQEDLLRGSFAHS